jgi:hypothetical protein
LFFTSVNSFPETGTTRNLLPLLVQRQLAGEGALRQLAEDTQRIKRGGLLSVKQVETAVWDIAFAGFYKQGLDRSDGGLSGQPFESFVKETWWHRI